jgi:hypothetical protein
MDELYAGENIVDVVIVTVVLGGGAAWLSGRAIARIWHPVWQVVVTAVLLAAAARFLHFALFGGDLMSLPSFCLDALILLVVGLLAWRTTRAAQMVRQYPWLYSRAGLFTWREIGQENRP